MHRFGDILMGVLVVAGVFVVTRPGSQAADVVGSITSGFAGLVQAATGQAPAQPPRRSTRPRGR